MGCNLKSSSIVQVQHEVLMTVAHNSPHFLLHNGVGIEDVELLAKTLFRSLYQKIGSTNLTLLAHLHNLVPFVADARLQEVSSQDARLYVSTVLRPICKSVCLPSAARSRLRIFLIKAFGEPASWSSLDLVQLGDLLVVFSRSDLAKVSPTALRRAASQLVSNSLYTEHLGDVRGFPETALYHEACSAWLGASKIQEGVEFFKAWRSLGEFYVLGSHLQVLVVEHNLNQDQEERRKRQVDVSQVSLEIKTVYIDVMNDMKSKFEAGTLTDEQKLAATNVITETQNKLGTFSIQVLGLEQGERTSQEVFAILKEYKDAGNMTDEQSDKMQNLAEDTQIAMIQGVVQVFNYTNEEAASEYNVNVAEMAELLQRTTFTGYVAHSNQDSALALLISASTTQAPLPGVTTEDALLVDLETLTTFATSNPRLPTTTPTPTLTSPDGDSFKHYEPSSPPLGPQFASLPASLATVQLGEAVLFLTKSTFPIA